MRADGRSSPASASTPIVCSHAESTLHTLRTDEDSPQLVAQLPGRRPSRHDRGARIGVGEHLGRREHRGHEHECYSHYTVCATSVTPRAVGDAPRQVTTVPALLERPLSARSVMASLLLGMHPPHARGSLLVRWCGLFGVAAGTARVALHRMTAKAGFRAHEGVYELAGRCVTANTSRIAASARRFVHGPAAGRWRSSRASPVRRASGRPCDGR